MRLVHHPAPHLYPLHRGVGPPSFPSPPAGEGRVRGHAGAIALLLTQNSISQYIVPSGIAVVLDTFR